MTTFELNYMHDYPVDKDKPLIIKNCFDKYIFTPENSMLFREAESFLIYSIAHMEAARYATELIEAEGHIRKAIELFIKALLSKENMTGNSLYADHFIMMMHEIKYLCHIKNFNENLLINIKQLGCEHFDLNICHLPMFRDFF